MNVFIVDPTIDIIDLKIIDGDEKMRLRRDPKHGYVTSSFEISVRQLVIQSAQSSCRHYTSEYPYYHCIADKMKDVVAVLGCDPPYMADLDANYLNPCKGIIPNVSAEVQDNMLSFWKKYTNGQLYEVIL